ncbi:MAG: sodium:solute symporter family protein [Desulfurococcales archaeon]|nr:sodium:solute symporter family protein [Desulfurococcales archaeon]
MDRLIIGLAILGLYMALGTTIAVLSRRRLESGEKSFYVAHGKLGSFLSAMTYAATTYSSFMIIGLVGFAYSTGPGALGFELVYLIATMGLLVIFSKSVWRMSRERGWISPGEMLADIYGSRWVAVAASLIYLISLIPYASSQLKGIGEAIAGMAGNRDYYFLGVILGIAVMILWSLVAGIWSVASTDALQGVWMLLAGTLLLVWLISGLHNSGVSLVDAFRVLQQNGVSGPGSFWTPGIFLAFTLPWMFFAVTNPQVVQRLYMPGDERALRNMVRWFSVFGLYYTVLVVLIGLLARAGYETGVLNINVDPSNPAQRDLVTPSLLYIANPILASIVFTSIIAASVSTADSILLTLSSSVSRDLGAGRRAGIVSIIIVGVVLALVAAARIQYIVLLSVLSSLMLLSLAPPTIAGWLGARGRPGIIIMAMSVGVLFVSAGIVVEVLSGSPLGVAVKKVFVSTPLGVPISMLILATSTVLTILSVALRR